MGRSLLTWIRNGNPRIIIHDLKPGVRASVVADTFLVVLQHARVGQYGTQQPVDNHRNKDLQNKAKLKLLGLRNACFFPTIYKRKTQVKMLETGASACIYLLDRVL